MNDPRIPNEQKEIAKQRYQPSQQQQPFISLQIANPPKPKPMAPTPLQYLPQTTIYPNRTQYPQYPQLFPGSFTAPVNVVNQLVIGDQNPHQDHQHIHMIYEDVLPLKLLPKSLNTLGERIVLSDFIKSVVLKGSDGNILPFRDGDNNIYDRLNVNELNPYRNTDDANKANPYSSLPTNMLLYRSCYPIQRVSNDSSAVSCANSSVGVNLRIYRLTHGEMLVNRTNDVKIYDSDVWREIMYYEYVRENILKTKQSPNFVMLFGYAMCNDSSIDFDKIEKLKHPNIYQPSRAIMMTQVQPLTFVQRSTLPQIGVPSVKPFEQPCIKTMQDYNGDILTAFTESPTYSLIQWASSSYMNVGKSKRMINTGYHPDDAWLSVIFQILASFIVMLKHDIHITNFNLNDNVYIKDLTGMSNITTYWKYVIDGVSYYVPNYGYLVMIDSKFKDLQNPNITVGTSVKQTNHKINGMFYGKSNMTHTHEIMTSLLDTINVNNFTERFVQNGGIKPSSVIIRLIGKINEYIDAKLKRPQPLMREYLEIVRDCVMMHIGKFMNNRIGTLLTKQEFDEIDSINKNFARGEMIVYEEVANSRKFAVYLENVGDTHYILDKTNGSDPIRVPIGNLYKYPNIQQIRQNYKPNEAKLDENDLLETYIMNIEN